MKIYRRRRYNLSLGRYYAILLSAILLLPVAGLSCAAQTSSGSAVNIKNFGKVNDHYYRGSQPNAEELNHLKQIGVKTIIDLRKDAVDEAPEWARAAGLQYVNIPLTTKRAATHEQTAYFLSLVNDQNKWPVYVHCKGGRHRTGQMTAIYRIAQDGWTGDQAYAEMKKYDFEDSFFYPRSLKKYVFSFYERFEEQQTLKEQAPTTALPQAP
jgi:protein tyrosine/serine phosphatase